MRCFVLSTPLARAHAIVGVQEAPEGAIVTIKASTRTGLQNARLWAYLGDISRQVVWYGRALSAEEWKHIFTAAIERQDVVPNIDGSGFVVLGTSTSNMSKAQFSDLLEVISAFGAERGVHWSAPESPAIT